MAEGWWEVKVEQTGRAKVRLILESVAENLSVAEDATKRGVVVRIDMTYAKEWKSAFATLVQAGRSE